MARAIGARAVQGGNAVEVTGRDAAKAKDLAAALGGGATAGTFGTAPAGDIVILAVPYTAAVPVVAQYGDAHAKASVSAFAESLELRPLDTGDLATAHWLEAAGPLLMGLARHGAGFNISLGVNVSG